MKKYISVILAAIMLVFCLSACGNSNTTNNSKNEKIQIVTTIFPEYDWVKEIIGENAEQAEVTMLLDNGVDLHSYQPTAEDILKISTCDIFIYVGGESDSWVEDALKEATNQDMKVINLLEVLGESVKTEEMVEGMQESEHNHGHDHAHDHEHEQEHDHEHEHNHDHAEEKDEHVWLSLKNAETLCEAISGALQEIDPEHKDVYADNTSTYIKKLAELDNEYKEVVNDAEQKTVLFGDRFPFRYLVDDYGLEYYAAFVGCSAETEASFETITFLAGKVDELGLNNVLTIEKSDQKIAETIVRNTKSKDQKIMTLDSMQSTTSEDVENGATYLSIMKNNLEVLREALK
ncbi:MAG TPA: zinc ABC transporter substrate-binding protein [Clostridiaceae bacterium]|nr:zinc ABC transporter substrate-binding protein [Clostridiaceae bacterium]